MARYADRVPENAAGDLFVDSSCIACDTCRRIDPVTFGGGEDDRSFVRRQPPTAVERRRALMALVSCPTASIGSLRKEGAAQAARAFPEPIADGVFDCGYASESSFGAASWLVVRPDGNVLVDSPRAAKPLEERIREVGGVRLMFLTHRDDVADHARWHADLGCDRVLHRRDVGRGTSEVEAKLEGDDPIALAPDLVAIPVPGHTRGSTALLYRDTFLFTGDHLWGDTDGRLGASRSVCWWSWEAQTHSMERLLDFRFEWVLPGHGRPWHALSAAAARAELQRLVRAMRRAP